MSDPDASQARGGFYKTGDVVGVDWSTGPLRFRHTTTEVVDGVAFVAVLQFGADGRLESKLLTREDLVRG